ncbi:MAG: flagellar motor protein MotB [Spirochaetaceae bacterium]|jgi:chemotaxis protein MotB|nr:flagellar motor protein MotB [Spirochaetaceae bacterium]
MAKKKKREDEGVKGDWIVTYSDMVTLLLCFFVALFDTTETVPSELATLFSSLNNIGMGSSTGGNTSSVGKMAELGNTISALPSMDRGRSLGSATRRAQSLFNPEVKSNKVTITHDERGLIISLAADAFFATASARLNIEETRDIFLRLVTLLNADELRGRKFRIEGHTDAEQPDANGLWEGSNWKLSVARSISVLEFISALGVDENRLIVTGYADTAPVAQSDTREGRAYNRRVDIVILDDGHL